DNGAKKTWRRLSRTPAVVPCLLAIERTGCQARTPHQPITSITWARCLGDLLPPSPPAEKTTARQHQAGQAGTGDGAGHWRKSHRTRRFKVEGRRGDEEAASNEGKGGLGVECGGEHTQCVADIGNAKNIFEVSPQRGDHSGRNGKAIGPLRNRD